VVVGGVTPEEPEELDWSPLDDVLPDEVPLDFEVTALPVGVEERPGKAWLT
jgi:hypothetical protein